MSELDSASGWSKSRRGIPQLPVLWLNGLYNLGFRLGRKELTAWVAAGLGLHEVEGLQCYNRDP